MKEDGTPVEARPPKYSDWEASLPGSRLVDQALLVAAALVFNASWACLTRALKATSS
jgi:hypothetical protein